ncbi:MAG TPA: hypothetical protein VEJ63_03315 [Planctomycetota bacterium]|nr:hypothetical protein [Planctomycetota bacterium]
MSDTPPSHSDHPRTPLLLFVVLALAVVAGALVGGRAFALARISEFDQWKTTGFGMFQCHRGTICFLQIRDERGGIAAEQLIEFSKDKVQVASIEDADSSLKKWVEECRARIEKLRQERRLHEPEYFGQAICRAKDGLIYYGAPPTQDFTKVLHFRDRTCLLFTSAGSRELQTLQSERVHIIFPVSGAPALGIELKRDAAGTLAWQNREFASVKLAHEELCARYSYTNYPTIVGRLNVWKKKAK